MYQFFSSLPEREINKRYLGKFQLKSFNKKFDAVMRQIPELSRLFPPGFKGEQLLILNFKDLTSVYYSYLNIIERVSEDRKKIIKHYLKVFLIIPLINPKLRNFSVIQITDTKFITVFIAIYNVFRGIKKVE